MTPHGLFLSLQLYAMAPWRRWISQLTSNQKIVGSIPTGVFQFFASIFAYCELKGDNAPRLGKRKGERGYIRGIHPSFVESPEKAKDTRNVFITRGCAECNRVVGVLAAPRAPRREYVEPRIGREQRHVRIQVGRESGNHFSDDS